MTSTAPVEPKSQGPSVPYARAMHAQDRGFWLVYAQGVRALVYALVAVAAAGILTMVIVTCAQVVARRFGHSLTGVFDIVVIAGAVSMAAALPYTTACKGHVAIEYFFQKLSYRGRALVDVFSRTVGILLFGLLAVESTQYGNALRDRGQVTPTLQVPEFWLLYVLAFSCAVVCLVKVYHLFHPGKELIKP